MIYLLGGPPRVGKTRLAEAVLQAKPMHTISTDAVRYMLRRSFPKSQLPPELFWSHEEHIESQRYGEALKHQHAESDALWPFLVELMKSYDEDGYNLLVEGVAVLPSLVHALQLEHKALFVGNNTPEHHELVMQLAEDNPHDWLHRYTVEQRAHYEQFFGQMSDWYYHEATKYGMPFAVLHDDTFDEDIAKTVQSFVI